MISYHDLTWLLPALVYAETHYRFRYFFSYLKKREPEIVADAPHRIEPGNTIPLLVLAKDAHRYPCTLRGITVTLSQDGTLRAIHRVLARPMKLREKWWWTVHDISRGGLTGWVDVNVEFEIETEGGRRAYRNDNYRTSSRKPLRVFLSDVPLPRLSGLHLGDAHYHSSFTDDQVEYGAPPAASVLLSMAMGLSFFGITDHSYDLDDFPDDYLRNDPSISKWKALQKETTQLNRKYRNRLAVLGGEEVSCRNSLGENVHLLLFGKRQFVRGSGDSAERWLRTRSEFSVAEVLDNLSEGTAVAAHPKEPVPFLQRLLLHRGPWSSADLRSEMLSGIQFLNGDYRDGFERGRQAWSRLLLAGSRIHAVAGNDAHGNFNRFRQLGIPFFSIREQQRQIFGKMRTGVFFKGPPTEESVLKAIRLGRTILSDGPVADMHASNADGKAAFLGEELEGNRFRITLTAKSSPEFGLLRRLRLHIGILGNDREALLFESTDVRRMDFVQTVSFEILQRTYVRLLVETSAEGSFDGLPHYCLSNPIWLHPAP